MQITEKYFRTILAELIEENAIGCRAILRISELVFTTEVPTLAVSLSGRPCLRVNLNFVAKHCQTEAHVKALLVHEFLHVLLNHTERFTSVTPALNIALDAVINAIIHRTLGGDYSSMMSNYYANATGAVRMLRPMTAAEQRRLVQNPASADQFMKVWDAVYQGKLIVDDLIDLADTCKGQSTLWDLRPNDGFLGNHDDWSGGTDSLQPETKNALRQTLQSMNGAGIWRAPRDNGVGRDFYKLEVPQKSEDLLRWERTAWKALRESVTPDRCAILREYGETTTSLPVMNERDRRGVLRSMWSPFIPEMSWTTSKQKPVGTTQVYLDVSGSMNAEMESLVALLQHLGRFIRMPFWAFSDDVAPATIEKGRLKTSTSGGTSMNSVLRHIAKTRPGRAVVITDGYIEECDPELLKGIRQQQIRCIVSRDGSPSKIERAGIPYVQLERFEND